MPGCNGDDVRLAPHGAIYVPRNSSYKLPTSANSDIRESWEQLGYIAEGPYIQGCTSPNPQREEDWLQLHFGAAQVSKLFFELLLRPFTALMMEWTDDESDQYRFVVERGRIKRKLNLLRRDALIVNVDCDVYSYSFFTDNPSVGLHNADGPTCMVGGYPSSYL